MIPALMSLLGSVVPDVLNRILPGEDIEVTKLKLQIQSELQKAVSAADLGQLEINKIEAANPNRAWPTWRECLGYSCVLVFLYNEFLQKLLAFLLSIIGINPVLPSADPTIIMTILSAMLGVHFVDSRYNSAAGKMPGLAGVLAEPDSIKSAAYVPNKGKLVDGIWQPD